MKGGAAALFAVALLPLVYVAIGLARKQSITLAPTSAAARLSAAKRASERLAFGVTGGIAAYGWAAAVFGLSTWVVPHDTWPMQFMSMMPLWVTGVNVLLLSVQPTNVAGVRVASYLMFAFLFLWGGQQWALLLLNPPAPFFVTGVVAGVVAKVGAFSIIPNFVRRRGCCCCSCACCCESSSELLPRVALARLWRSLRAFCFVFGFFFINWGLSSAGVTLPVFANVATNEGNSTLPPMLAKNLTAGPADVPGAFATAVTCWLFALGMRPPVRRWAHGLLGALTTKGEARAAAAVAGLVGGRSPAQALKHGTATFRGLPFTGLSEHDLSTSSDTGLHAKTVKASLGEVQAFLSHSWHDDAAAKWKVLEGWAAACQSSSPLLWLDKVRRLSAYRRSVPPVVPKQRRTISSLTLSSSRFFPLCVHGGPHTHAHRRASISRRLTSRWQPCQCTFPAVATCWLSWVRHTPSDCGV